MNTVRSGCIWEMNSMELLRKAGIECTINKEIRQIVRYAQMADEYSIFVDVSRHKDEKYLKMALEKGAIVLSEEIREGCIHVENAARTLTDLLQIFYGFPYQKLTLIGVTGTCGKSTVIHLLRDCLKHQGKICCAVMTQKVYMADELIETNNTTPDASFLIPLMKKCIEQGIDTLMMEVSSEAYLMHRVDGLYFDVMIGTVIASDHLDSHRTLEHYQNTKRKILSLTKPGGILILNADDPLQRQWMRSFDAHVVTYGFTPSSFQISNCKESLERTSFHFQQIPLMTKLLSKTNVSNLAAVMVCAFVLDLKMKQVLLWVNQVRGCPGRFEIINHLPCIMVDYAHTEKAVKSVLSFLRRITKNRIICVFGCGGQRDATKRPLIGKAVSEYADVLIVTSDNPRGEDPEQIINDIVAGCTKAVYVQKDRMKAIQFALETCTKNDIIVLLGKGDEKSLFAGGYMIPESDAEAVFRILKEEKVWENTFLF